MRLQTKALILKVIRRKHGKFVYLYLTVMMQTHKGNQFGKTGRKFVASNGVTLIANDDDYQPLEWWADKRTLFLGRGELEVSEETLKIIAQAVRDYNTVFQTVVPNDKSIIY